MFPKYGVKCVRYSFLATPAFANASTGHPALLCIIGLRGGKAPPLSLVKLSAHEGISHFVAFS